MDKVNKILCHPQFTGIVAELSELEKDRPFCGHSIDHLLAAARIMWINVLEEKLELKKSTVYAAALLHDIGRAAQYKHGLPHAEKGAEIAAVILKDCGFSPNETKEICGAINAHNSSDIDSELMVLLRRADKLSRNCFSCKAVAECNWPIEKRNQGITI